MQDISILTFLISVSIYSLILYYVSKKIDKNDMIVFILMTLIIGHILYWKDLKDKKLIKHSVVSIILFLIIITLYLNIYYK
jgi:membrane protein DedA with SNARE-associated domain